MEYVSGCPRDSVLQFRVVVSSLFLARKREVYEDARRERGLILMISTSRSSARPFSSAARNDRKNASLPQLGAFTGGRKWETIYAQVFITTRARETIETLDLDNDGAINQSPRDLVPAYLIALGWKCRRPGVVARPRHTLESYASVSASLTLNNAVILSLLDAHTHTHTLLTTRVHVNTHVHMRASKKYGFTRCDSNDKHDEKVDEWSTAELPGRARACQRRRR